MGRNLSWVAYPEEFTTMGATWFVSYSYYQHIDSKHKHWENVGYDNRISKYNQTKNLCVKIDDNEIYLHKYYLQKVLEMNDKRLNKNKISLCAKDTKRMAQEIIDSGKLDSCI